MRAGDPHSGTLKRSVCHWRTLLAGLEAKRTGRELEDTHLREREGRILKRWVSFIQPPSGMSDFLRALRLGTGLIEMD